MPTSSQGPVSRGTRAGDIAAVIERAPAKLNLALHVVGLRDDGYHELQSVVTFANVVDTVRVAAAERDGLTVSGEHAQQLADDDGNLVVAARDALRTYLSRIDVATPPVAIHLEKNLPVAAGVGGGSADAAAALRALVRLWKASVTPAELADIAAALGADVPMCLMSRPLAAEGIGEKVRPIAPFPAFDMVLVNPGRAVATPEVFRSLASHANPALRLPQSWGRPAEAVALLAAMRNDLEQAAEAIVPEIGEARAALARAGALLARMSGSGATCFGIFAGAEPARAAARSIKRLKPDWYVVDCRSFYGVPDRPARQQGSTA